MWYFVRYRLSNAFSLLQGYFAHSNLAGFSFAAMAATMAGQPLALVGLAQGTIHPTGCHKLLQCHFLFSINHMFLRIQKTGQPLVDRVLVACRSKKDIFEPPINFRDFEDYFDFGVELHMFGSDIFLLRLYCNMI